MNKKYVVKQNGFRDCAVAALMSVIRYNGGNLGYSELEYLVNCSNEGTSAYNMIEGMKKIGFQGKGLKIKFENLINSDIETPFVAHMKTDLGYHYIVVYEINKKKKVFDVMDPGQGNIKITYDSFKKNYLNTILEFKKVKEIPCLNEKNELLAFILKRVLDNKNKIIMVSILTILITLLSLVINYNMKLNIDYIIAYNRYEIVKYIFILFILIVLLKNTLTYIRDKFVRNLEYDLNNKINYKIINHLFRMPYKYFFSHPTGEMVSRINDMEYLKSFLNTLFLNIFVDIFIICITSIGLIIISTKLTICFCIILIIYAIISVFFMYLYNKVILRVQISSSAYQTSLIEDINSYESIKNLNRVDNSISELNCKYLNSSKAILAFKKIISVENLIKNIIIDSLYVVISVTGINMVKNGSITLGDLVSFTTIYIYALTPIKDILDSLIDYVYSKNSYNRINDFLLIKEEEKKETREMIDGDIEFKNITYTNNKKVLDNFNLTIHKNDKILLRGKSGCGKSTLLKLLKKYILEYEGNIYINKINLRNLDKSIIDNSVMYVSQNEKIYTGSIKNNIILNRKVSNKDYQRVNEITLFDKIIDLKYFKDEELIESDGFNLSGGEKQKLILSRALLNNFNYLILDEALSEVDEEDERLIVNNLLERYKDKTIIYVSHKDNIGNMFNIEKRID